MTKPLPTTFEVVQQIPLEEIVASPFRTNRQLGDLEELAASIRARGMLQPILVRPWRGHWQMVVGARRHAAAKLVGLKTVPALVREMTDDEVVAAQLVADLQRRDIHPLDEATAFKRLQAEHQWSTDRISAEVGKSRSYVLSRLKLNELAPAAWEALVDEKIRTTTAVVIARIPAPDLQEKAIREVLRASTPSTEPMTHDEAVEHIRRNYMLTSLGDRLAPTDIFDCTTLRARLTASSCVSRQNAFTRIAANGAQVPAYTPCGLGTCQQGLQVKAALGASAPTTPVAIPQETPYPHMGRVRQPSAPGASREIREIPEEPVREKAIAIEEAASVGSLLSLPVIAEEPAEEPGAPPASPEVEPQPAQRLKQPSRQTRAWMAFTEEQQIDGVIEDPRYWADAVLKVVAEHLPFDTEGQRLAALLAAAGQVSGQQQIARTAHMRLAGDFFDTFKAAPASLGHGDA